MDNEDGAMDRGQDEKQLPPDVLYADIDADSQAPTQIESLCVNCGQNVSNFQPFATKFGDFCRIFAASFFRA